MFPRRICVNFPTRKKISQDSTAQTSQCHRRQRDRPNESLNSGPKTDSGDRPNLRPSVTKLTVSNIHNTVSVFVRSGSGPRFLAEFRLCNEYINIRSNPADENFWEIYKSISGNITRKIRLHSFCWIPGLIQNSRLTSLSIYGASE